MLMMSVQICKKEGKDLTICDLIVPAFFDKAQMLLFIFIVFTYKLYSLGKDNKF